MKQVKAYKTEDGKIYETKEEAEKHMFYVLLGSMWLDLDHNGVTDIDFLWDNKMEIYKVMQQFCAPQYEEAGK